MLEFAVSACLAPGKTGGVSDQILLTLSQKKKKLRQI